MNKNDLVEAVAGHVGDRRAAAAAVEAVLGTVMRAVRDGERVALSGFGVFEKVERAARSARNPSTGATVAVPATSAPRFRPGQVFKDVVSGGRELTQGPVRLARTAPTAKPVVADEPVVQERTDLEPGKKAAKKSDAKKPATKKSATKKSDAKKPKSDAKKSAPPKDGKKSKKAGKK